MFMFRSEYADALAVLPDVYYELTFVLAVDM